MIPSVVISTPIIEQDPPTPLSENGSDLPDEDAERMRLSRAIQQSLEPYQTTLISISSTLRFPPPYPIRRMKELDDELNLAQRTWEDEVVRREEVQRTLADSHDALRTPMPLTPSTESSPPAPRVNTCLPSPNSYQRHGNHRPSDELASPRDSTHTFTFAYLHQTKTKNAPADTPHITQVSNPLLHLASQATHRNAMTRTIVQYYSYAFSFLWHFPSLFRVLVLVSHVSYIGSHLSLLLSMLALLVLVPALFSFVAVFTGSLLLCLRKFLLCFFPLLFEPNCIPTTPSSRDIIHTHTYYVAR